MLPPGHEAQPQQHAGVHVAQGPAPAIPSPLAWISCRIHSPAPRGASLSPEQCSQHGMSSKIAAGKSGSERGAEPCPWAEDQECLFPIQHAKALNPAKPKCLFLPLASKGWQQKHVRGRRSSVEEGSGFLLGLSDLFWFGKNRHVQRCSQCTSRLFPLPQQQNRLCGLLQTQETGAQSHNRAFGCWGGTRNPAPGSAFACLQGKFMCSHGTSLWAPCLPALVLWDTAPAVGQKQFFLSLQQLSQVFLESMDWELCQQCPWP